MRAGTGAEGPDALLASSLVSPLASSASSAARGLPWSVRLCVLLLACLPSLGTLRAPWISDDALILGHVHRHGALADWVQPQYDLLTIRFWRPLVSLSWSVQEQLFGVDPVPFRALNLACHALAALFVAELAWTLGAGRLAALLAGVACGFFPEQGGTVTWVAGRVDSLTLPFFAAALLALARGRALLAGACAFLACACKETSFALPALATAVVLAGGGGETRGRALRTWLALCAACTLAFGWRSLALGDWLGGYPAPAGGALAAALHAGRALWSAEWPTITGTLVLGLLGVCLGTARPRLLLTGLACALFAAAPLFALLADGVLEPTNRRTLAFFDLGLALSVGGALARWRPGGVRWAMPVLAFALCAMRARLAWQDTHEWAEAGRISEDAMERARAEAQASGAGHRPLLALALPRVHEGAYALAWGVADRAREPFPASLRPIWPARPVFTRDGSEERAFETPYERIGSSVLRREGTDEPGSLHLSAEGGGPLLLQVDERVPQASPDRSPAVLLDAAELGGFDGVELVLYTELGYQPFALGALGALGTWDPARSRLSLMEAFALSDGSVSLADVWLLAASTGALDAWLEVRAWRGSPASTVASSQWIELDWDSAVMEVARAYVH